MSKNKDKLNEFVEIIFKAFLKTALFTKAYRCQIRRIQTFGTRILQHRLHFFWSLQTNENNWRCIVSVHFNWSVCKFWKHQCSTCRDVDIAVCREGLKQIKCNQVKEFKPLTTRQSKYEVRSRCSQKLGSFRQWWSNLEWHHGVLTILQSANWYRTRQLDALSSHMELQIWRSDIDVNVYIQNTYNLESTAAGSLETFWTGAVEEVDCEDAVGADAGVSAAFFFPSSNGWSTTNWS